MKLKSIILVILGILAFVIIMQNTRVVTVQLFFWQLVMSRIVLILVMMAIGVAIGYIIARAGRK
ncbi:hypothetical protein AMJ74_02260 [candidate division WOR_3 bacterium SM1_77]|uniref:Lipopolysaccharide assembly protein A domain-containing protein n=1 Tax=candidate division WOR_3 bacterium SM1_77 TaxID=1703778 RepID=A0A0S8K0R8_UNCW3|nr:MAG: hypothetical protein AMJ74_02260 [candidate division WOR_3 bacterium SM1_77]